MKQGRPMTVLWRAVFFAGLPIWLTCCAVPSADSPPAVAPALVTPPPEDYVGDSSAGAFLAGRAAQGRHDLREAALYLTQAQQQDPDNVEVLRRTTIALALLGDVDDAAVLAARTEIFDDEATVPAMLLAAQAAKKGDWAAVNATVDHLPERGLNNYLAPLTRGWAKMGEGKIDAGLEALAGLDHLPGLTVLRDFNSGLINDLADRHAAAEKSYRATLSSPAGRTLRTTGVIAGFFHRIGNDAEAQALLAAFRKEHADMPPVLIQDQRAVNSARDGLSEAFFGAAGTLRQSNVPDLALLFCQLALDLRPDFPLARLMAGDILSGLGQWNLANQDYLTLTPDSPLYEAAQMRLAHNFEDMDQVDQAVRLLTAMQRRHPDQPDLDLALGDLWRRQKQWLDAVQAYDRALKLLPADGQAQWAIYYARGVALERANLWPRAEADFLQALALQPDEPEVLNYLGYSWVEQGTHLARATAMIEKAAKLRPTDGFIIDSLGWAFYRSGDFNRAVETLQKAVSLVPGDAAINDHLGDALWYAGRPEEARFQWQHALLFDPEPDLKAQLADKLKQGQPPPLVIPDRN